MNKEKTNTIEMVFIIALFMIAMLGFSQQSKQLDDFQHEAVNLGFAEYYVSTNKAVEFRWKKD